MSFGPSQNPAKYTPFVGASTGLSLGCDSMKKPSDVRESVSIPAILLKSFGGWTPIESTTMSSSCRSSLPRVVFSTVTVRLPVSGSSSMSPGSPRMYLVPASFDRWNMSSNDFPKARMSW